MNRKIAFVAAALLSQAAMAQEWTPRFDLLTAGAAASVILTQICQGSDAGKAAARQASVRIQDESNQMAEFGIDPAKVYEYSADSYSMKIKAMWQANSDSQCSELTRLRHIAQYTGFQTP